MINNKQGASICKNKSLCFYSRVVPLLMSRALRVPSVRQATTLHEAPAFGSILYVSTYLTRKRSGWSPTLEESLANRQDPALFTCRYSSGILDFSPTTRTWIQFWDKAIHMLLNARHEQQATAFNSSCIILPACLRSILGGHDWGQIYVQALCCDIRWTSTVVA